MENTLRTKARLWLTARTIALTFGCTTFLQAQVTRPHVTPAESETSSSTEAAIVLSPFQVTSSAADVGYYTENTLAGTRLNSQLKDIAASITVVTAQQLEDTGAVDLNDIFVYEGNTEGARTYTDIEVDRSGGVSDRGSLNPESSNRVRGIGRADMARDYFISSSQIPIDAYNLSSVTINRGPNSVLFGLGSAAGIINITPTKAQLNHRSYEANLRYSTYQKPFGSGDSYRASFNFNTPVIPDKLAVYVAALYDDKGYMRQPSYDETTRYYGAVTYQPFAKTTIRASYEDFVNESRRPNTITPRDFVTAYRGAGSPTWDPLTYTATLADGTKVLAPATAQIPLGLREDPRRSQPLFYIENGVNYGRFQRQIGNGTPGVQAANQPQRVVASDHPFSNTTLYPLFTVPGVSSRSLYDWNSINLSSPNFDDANAGVYTVTLEQQLARNLFLELGWFREDFDSLNSSAINGESSLLSIDPNRTLLDGTPNPFFGKPYIENWEPSVNQQTEDNSTYRATLAYDFDFSKNTGWTRWLGRHNLMGLWQHRDAEDQFVRWREAVVSSHAWANTANKWSGSNAQIRYNRRWYLGDAGGGVTRAPGGSGMLGRGELWDHSLRHFLWQSQQWTSETATGGLIIHPSGGTNQQKIDSLAAALQSFWWKDRIVTTLGVRHDASKFRTSDALTARTPEGLVDPAPLRSFSNPWEESSGNTTTLGVVFHGTDWLNFHYNESDNFTPERTKIDLRGNVLPLPTGEGRDYGFSLSTPENRVVAKFNWYETTQRNSRTAGDTGTIVYRARRLDTDLFIPFIRYQIGLRNGLSPGDAVAARPLAPEGQAVYSAEVAKIAGLGEDFFTSRLSTDYSDTSTVTAKGFEFSLHYNPTPNWNVKFNATQQKTIETESAPRLPDWLAERMAIWTSALGVGDGTPFWTTPGAIGEGSTVAADWYLSIVDAPLQVLRASEGKARPQVREWRMNLITNYRFTSSFLRGVGVGGSARWEDRGAIGYMGIPGANGVIRQLDADNVIWDSAHTYFDFWASYSRKILRNKIGFKIQLNVRNAFESGGLQAVRANPDGSPSVFRILEPRQFVLSTTFSF